jgi:hypothetical protein
MSQLKYRVITAFRFLFLGINARASLFDTLIQENIEIDRLKIGSNYEITIFSSSCYSAGSIIIRITKDECGFSLDGGRSIRNKYEKKKKTQYKIISLSEEQLEAVRSFELLLKQLIEKPSISEGICYIGKSTYSICQDGKCIIYSESCESKLFSKLKPLLIEVKD